MLSSDVSDERIKPATPNLCWEFIVTVCTSSSLFTAYIQAHKFTHLQMLHIYLCTFIFTLSDFGFDTLTFTEVLNVYSVFLCVQSLRNTALVVFWLRGKHGGFKGTVRPKKRYTHSVSPLLNADGKFPSPQNTRRLEAPFEMFLKCYSSYSSSSVIQVSGSPAIPKKI